MTTDATHENKKRSLYRNTVIFAIIAAIITVIMLGVAIFVPEVAAYRLLFLTVEVGLLAITINAVVKIRRYEKKTQELLLNAANNVLEVNTCPNFFTSERRSDGHVTCHNKYKSPRHGTVFRILSTSGRPVPERIELGALEGLPMKRMCKEIDPPDEDDPKHNIPWTELRTKCDSVLKPNM